ncbi:hypothetical protein MHUMG1_10601 [Metarhizium humberi]|uniref:Uncharacterized protein n=1 Tax=Metarhizium humberi TaxID=2596975 RepID=A0A9P8M0S2_9HYPO|nr:hypothetical protein MHUMG1_10601 [Metarhizium humberi]
MDQLSRSVDLAHKRQRKRLHFVVLVLGLSYDAPLSPSRDYIRLHELGLTYIGDFLDFIERCQPGLETKIRNLSYVLPRLITSGLPTGGLLVETSELDHPDTFNRCFPLPAGTDAADLQLLHFSADISSWPEQPTTGCLVSDKSEDDSTEQDGLASQQSWDLSPEEGGLYGVGCDLEVSEAFDILGF